MNELLRKIYEDDSFPVKTVQELEHEYEEEMKKSFEQRDFDLLGELAETILEMKGVEVNPAPIDSVKERIKIYEKKRKNRNKRLITVTCAVLVIAFPINFASQKVYGMNILSSVVEIVSGRMNIDNRKNDVPIELPKSADDQLGLRAECESYGINVLLPGFIPDGLNLVIMEFTETPEIKTADFVFKKGNQQINTIIYQYINGISENFQMSADGSIEEVNINGKLAVIIKDGKEYRVTFTYEDTIYRIDTKNVDYNTIMAVLYSFQ